MTYSVSCDVLPLYVDADHTTDDNIGISNQMRAGHAVAMGLIGNPNDAVDPTFEGDWGICDTRRPHESRQRFLNASLFEFIAPSLEGGGIHCVAELITGIE